MSNKITAYQSDPRLGRADIAQRIAAAAALQQPWEYYQHHDGSLWDGYGMPILEPNLAIVQTIDPAVCEFWQTVWLHYDDWLADDLIDLGHPLHPISGKSRDQSEPLPGFIVLRERGQQWQAYIAAERRKAREYEDLAIEALTGSGFAANHDDSIADRFAGGANPEDLLAAGILQGDAVDYPAPAVQPQWSPWANPNFNDYVPPCHAIEPGF